MNTSTNATNSRSPKEKIIGVVHEDHDDDRKRLEVEPKKSNIMKNCATRRTYLQPTTAITSKEETSTKASSNINIILNHV